MRVNFNNESALIRAVLVTNNFDSQTFPELLNLLAPSLHLLDSSRRTVLHHIAQVASNKGRGAATRYYMECILEYVAKHGGSFSSFIDAVDVHGDTALNLAARIGARNLVDQLMDVGANSEIENLAGLNPSSFGFTRFNDAISVRINVSQLVI
jgi:ankyrin repeat protein